MLSPKINSLSSILNRILTEASMLCSAVDYRISTPLPPYWCWHRNFRAYMGRSVHIPRTCANAFVFFWRTQALNRCCICFYLRLFLFSWLPNQAPRTCAGQPPPRHQVIHIIHSLYILPPSLSYLFLVCVIFVLAMLLQEKQNRRTIIF